MKAAVAVAEMTGADAPALVDLLMEMQAHYGAPCPSCDAAAAGLAAMPVGARALVARVEGSVVGFAFFAGQYPGPGLKPGLYLKELYVAAFQRGAGVGAALMRALLDLAAREGYARVDFTAAHSNAALMAFYARFAAKRLTDRSAFRITL